MNKNKNKNKIGNVNKDDCTFTSLHIYLIFTALLYPLFSVFRNSLTIFQFHSREKQHIFSVMLLLVWKYHFFIRSDVTPEMFYFRFENLIIRWYNWNVSLSS